MGLFTKSDRVKELESKAGNWDNLTAAILQSNPEMKTEEITPQMIVDELIAASVDNNTDPELQSKFDNLQSDYNTVVSERDALQEQVTNLLDGPAGEPAPISSTGELTGKSDTLLDFANKNKGNTAAIIQEAVKDGFLPK